MSSAIFIDRDKLAVLCLKRHIERLAFFGSAVRSDFAAHSDVDIIVDFEENRVPGFLEMYEIEQELSQLLEDRKVDLLTRKALHPRLRRQVLESAEVQYAAR